VKNKKKIKPRNPYVVGAKQRSGAGPMSDGRKRRGGSRGTGPDDPIQSGLEEWESEARQDEASGELGDADDAGEG
jgi:hypothetical protein